MYMYIYIASYLLPVCYSQISMSQYIYIHIYIYVLPLFCLYGQLVIQSFSSGIIWTYYGYGVGQAGTHNTFDQRSEETTK